MEEPISVRYCFVMLLAICDITGHVIGTDVAIARRINMPLEDFQRAMGPLMEPDPHSNSQELEGRRVVLSEQERGYRVVNYLVYRDLTDQEQRRTYMRDYMRKYRVAKYVAPVNSCKRLLTHTEAEAEAEAEKKTSSSRPKAAPSESGLEFADWFRKFLPETTKLSPSYRTSWAKAYDDMIRLDDRDDAGIRAVCEWARGDSFWKSNFQSPVKLRDRSKQGVMWYDVFSEKMKQDDSQPAGKRQPGRISQPGDEEW